MDHSVFMDHSQPVPATLDLSVEQLRVMLQPTRKEIIDLLTDGPAFVSQIARAVERPKSTIAHHCNVLTDVGLIHVTRTRRVRAIDERFYARSARTFLLGRVESEAEGVHRSRIAEAAAEEERWRAAHPQSNKPAASTFRQVRIPDERVEEWIERFTDLVTEFVDQERGGDTRYGLVLGIFPTTKPVVNGEEE